MMNTEQFTKHASLKRELPLLLSSLNNLKNILKYLVEWNEKMNLTAITDKEDVYLKHFYDSISAAFYFDLSSHYIFVMLVQVQDFQVFH